jgi:hypothetical protein
MAFIDMRNVVTKRMILHELVASSIVHRVVFDLVLCTSTSTPLKEVLKFQKLTDVACMRLHNRRCIHLSWRLRRRYSGGCLTRSYNW